MDLEPCRFCGSVNLVEKWPNIRCTDCKARAPIEVWNNSADGWHKWPDEKPNKESEWYWVYRKNGVTQKAWYLDNVWTSEESDGRYFDLNDVTHFHELPTPPKEDA